MGRIRIQFLVPDGQWHSEYIFDENINYNATSTEWSLLDLDFAETNYSIELVNDLIDATHVDVRFSDNMTTYSI